MNYDLWFRRKVRQNVASSTILSSEEEQIK